MKASAEAKLEVDKFWQSFRYEESKSKEHPGLKVRGLWGYDQGSKRYVSTAVGNHGEWNTASAPGWEGDKLVWTGEISGTARTHRLPSPLHEEGGQGMGPRPRAANARWKVGPSEEITCKK